MLLFPCAFIHAHVCVRVHRPPTRFSEEDNELDYVMYDLDDLDINWLESVNQKRKFRGQYIPNIVYCFSWNLMYAFL